MTRDGGFPFGLLGSKAIGTDGKGGGSTISHLSGSIAQLLKEALRNESLPPRGSESLPPRGRGKVASPLCLGTLPDETSPGSQ
mmetsp:Transcript_32290/g.70662  ORF Transcript_32290/g.70662 Transcript_32290/m.70662 type:complete len:83 (-) Transcript_32290:330-578(-)